MKKKEEEEDLTKEKLHTHTHADKHGTHHTFNRKYKD